MFRKYYINSKENNINAHAKLQQTEGFYGLGIIRTGRA